MKKQKCKGVLGMFAVGLLGLWPVDSLRAQEAEAEEPTRTAVKCDTIRMTWEAEAGEEKSFSFKGVSDGWFTIHWGDGEKTVSVIGGGNVIHTYANAGRYEVLLCGVPYQKWVWQGEDYTEPAFGMELEMVYVEGGTFKMGAISEQGSYVNDDKPVHSVTLSDFYIGKYEVTQSQWVAVMGTNPCSSSFGLGDDYPMYYVNWEEANEFCAKLSELTGKTYRLPTEAEWEYAARGGQKADGTEFAGSNTIGDVAWYDNNSYALGESHPDFGVHPVGQKLPNGLGLYDMSGNVWEWCQDRYDRDYYSESPAVNPQGPSSGSVRVNRGGSWNSYALHCRVSNRNFNTPGNRSNILGFRVVCPL